jgi:2-polyprenyl-3-methyl-5-hydroxy-6-metoxy-1,4-benzoquinol methylase
LVVGCGNSELSEKIHLKMGMNQVLSIDFEENVI